ncbi:MAG: putative folate metabolism gamma-glutamate ligase [Clostridiales bacterium]|nr:putative folate metabolism gamma-glutamate ligase [Clostridiales bacterium]
MIVTALKTQIVEKFSCSIEELLSTAIKSISENSIIAISSKVISLCEGNIVEKAGINKDELIEREADFFLPKSKSKYNVYLTIKNNLLIPSSGVDESNTNGYYLKLPKDSQKTANLCWSFLRKKHSVENLGIIITDSAPSPLRWGVTGRCIACCGFKPINNKIGEKDLFGNTLTKTQVNIADALATSAVLCMGESNEQTPIAIIEDLGFVNFVSHIPTEQELEEMNINIKDDLYEQILTSVKWKTHKKP